MAGERVDTMGEAELRRLRAETIGMVFQHMALWPHRTLGGNVGFGLEVRGMGPEARRDAAQRALEADPDERVNLAGDPAQADRVAGFADEAAAKWDIQLLSGEIKASQQRRILIRDAAAQGEPIRWNHGERPDEDVPWQRGKQGYNEWAFDYLPPADSVG